MVHSGVLWEIHSPLLIPSALPPSSLPPLSPLIPSILLFPPLSFFFLQSFFFFFLIPYICYKHILATIWTPFMGCSASMSCFRRRLVYSYSNCMTPTPFPSFPPLSSSTSLSFFLPVLPFPYLLSHFLTFLPSLSPFLFPFFLPPFPSFSHFLPSSPSSFFLYLPLPFLPLSVSLPLSLPPSFLTSPFLPPFLPSHFPSLQSLQDSCGTQ